MLICHAQDLQLLAFKAITNAMDKQPVLKALKKNIDKKGVEISVTTVNVFISIPFTTETRYADLKELENILTWFLPQLSSAWKLGFCERRTFSPELEWWEIIITLHDVYVRNTNSTAAVNIPVGI